MEQMEGGRGSAWLGDVMAGLAARRTVDLLHWDLSAPHHRACHPREDHLVPICCGMRGGG